MVDLPIPTLIGLSNIYVITQAYFLYQPNISQTKVDQLLVDSVITNFLDLYLLVKVN